MSVDVFSQSNAGPIWSILGPYIQAILQQQGGGAGASAAPATTDPMQLLLQRILSTLLAPPESPVASTPAASAAPALGTINGVPTSDPGLASYTSRFGPQQAFESFGYVAPGFTPNTSYIQRER